MFLSQIADLICACLSRAEAASAAEFKVTGDWMLLTKSSNSCKHMLSQPCCTRMRQGCTARSTTEAVMHLLLQRCTAPHQAPSAAGTVRQSETVLKHCQQAQGRRLCAAARKVVLVSCEHIHFTQPHAEILCQIPGAMLLTLAAHKQPPQKVQHWRSGHSAVRSQGSCELLASLQAYSLGCNLCTGA